MYTSRQKSTETGEIMLESTIIVTLTLFILIWLLALGFLHYQRYVLTVVTNDAAVKIASTYNNPASDIIMGYTTTEELCSRDLYRGYVSDNIFSGLPIINKRRVEAYVKYMLDRTNFVGVMKDVDVKMRLVHDSGTRRHVEVTTTASFNTPFGFALDFFGMDGVTKYEATACSDCTDIADYISSVDYGTLWEQNAFLSDAKIVGSIAKLLNSLTKAYNHITA